MSAAAALVAVFALSGVAVLQVLGAAGLPVGRFLWGGAHRVLPTRLRVGSAVSVVMYALMGAVLLSRGGVLPGGEAGFVVVATWVLFTYFALGIVVNAISRSVPERVVMTLACALLAAASLTVAIG